MCPGCDEKKFDNSDFVPNEWYGNEWLFLINSIWQYTFVLP